VQICRLSQVSFECLLLVSSKVANFPFDLLAVLSPGIESQRKLSGRVFLLELFMVLLLKKIVIVLTDNTDLVVFLVVIF